MAACSDGGDSKTSPPGNKEHLSSIVREISQARLISLRKKRSGLSMSLGVQDNGRNGMRPLPLRPLRLSVVIKATVEGFQTSSWPLPYRLKARAGC